MTWTVPLLYNGFVLALCTYLLIRGATHSFVALFAASALLGLLRTLGFIIIQRAPGGFSDNMRFIPAVNVVGTIGVLLSVAGFVALAAYLLRNAPSNRPAA